MNLTSLIKWICLTLFGMLSECFACAEKLQGQPCAGNVSQIEGTEALQSGQAADLGGGSIHGEEAVAAGGRP